ncbi:hypothetical protein K7432_005958 [Basidiobolus ranarum]|uniref:Uncharacterized protein n=1 Tax=Basidiobolus ranarum TaxID=34480 RepID=A0ABR2W2R5_9FUNG
MFSPLRILLVASLAVTCLETVLAERMKFTYYWISEESDFTGPKDVELQSCSGETLATVSQQFASAARMEGTAILGDGQVINLQCDCNGGYSCFSFINEELYPYGLGAWDNALVPFVSVASNDLPQGTLLMVKQLEGLQLPNGQYHNGCVRVDDQGWGLIDKQIDFMVGLEKYYVKMDNRYENYLNYVDVRRTHCTPGTYKTIRD